VNASGHAATRIVAMGIVLTLAAVLGLVAGNALNSRHGGAINPGAGAASMPHLSGFDGARYEALEGTAIGAPAYADPYRLQIQRGGQADLPDTVFPNVWGNIAAPDPVTSESWGNIAAPDPVTSESWGNIANDAEADEAFTQTWGNLDERHDARPSNGTSVRESLTAPAPR
jgi:hypothetical protein